VRVHILGICGTFMGGIAAIARDAGHVVSGSDANVYPPMSTQLKKLGVRLHEGYDAGQLDDDLDCVVVGNALSRGKPVVEELLNRGLPYFSGPEWLAANVLRDKWVLAVSGTHGKTTTSSMLAWILEHAGLNPGFLIGGVPSNFSISARLSSGKHFVVEADEYDTAFFDKRAKFVHYRPRTLVITNIEHDHADIYRDVDAILWQFHQLLRTVPGEGLIAANAGDANIEKLFSQGVWTGIETFSAGGGDAVWTAAYGPVAAKSTFSVRRRGELLGETAWSLIGTHNLENALAALIAATHAGVPPEIALRALAKFKGVKRRLERLGVFGGITVYEDFAHHPTAIAATLRAVRSQQPQQRLVAVIEPRSNTMRMGTHRESLPLAFEGADKVFVLASRDLSWNPQESLGPLGSKLAVAWDRDDLVSALVEDLNRGDNVVLMSNGSFQGLPRALQHALKSRDARSGTT
jgi:UDP-N-acetylmuramate: L-alanyl-gamma-D-glutamyl-meso-diaminopimelate ligase